MKSLCTRAFELQDLQVWCARNSARLDDVHDCYHYLKHLETLCKVDWENYMSETDFLKDTAAAFEQYKQVVRRAFKF